jgi:molybdopterin-guanine dinucleotide biosynthesis protein B
MKTTKLLAVVGSKNSGKTTTVECVISGLTKRGFRVGSIKHIHHPDFTIDTEGTDTWRHANAGSKMVVVFSNKEIALIVKDDPEETLPSVLEFMTNRKADIVVVEGLHSSIGQRPDVFKILTAHDSEDLQQRLRGTIPPIVAISGRVAEDPSRLTGVDVPVINSKTDCAKLVDRIEKEVFRE